MKEVIEITKKLIKYGFFEREGSSCINMVYQDTPYHKKYKEQFIIDYITCDGNGKYSITYRIRDEECTIPHHCLDKEFTEIMKKAVDRKTQMKNSLVIFLLDNRNVREGDYILSHKELGEHELYDIVSLYLEQDVLFVNYLDLDDWFLLTRYSLQLHIGSYVKWFDKRKDLAELINKNGL